MFALVDCNNFYTECERVFNPKLESQPIVILSKNDRCVISRSDEAKYLGIKMGEPFFKIRDLVKKHSVFVLSSNYRLYGDMSARVMVNLEKIFHEVEEYSIDEAFVDLHHFTNFDLKSLCYKAKKIIRRNVGIPISMGVGKTKTLAKIANNYAKSHLKGNICIINKRNESAILSNCPVKEVWGIGKETANRLYKTRISSSLDLRNIPSKQMCKMFNLTSQKTVYELRGFSCIPIEEHTPKRSILSSRTFSTKINNFSEMQEALTTYALRACEKLAQKKYLCGKISIFIKSTDIIQGEKFYNNITYEFDRASNNSRDIVQIALMCLKEIYKNNISYSKLGIILHELKRNNMLNSLVRSTTRNLNTGKITDIIDKINHKYGSKSIYPASQKVKSLWNSKSEMQGSFYPKTILEVN
ncbi:MAG: hypothetical protein RLN62_02795 [Rickettsiales bacterium]